LAKVAQTNYTMGNIFASVGGFLIGWPVGTALRGDKPNWNLAAAGAGLVVLGIPFVSAGNKKLKEAVDLYNAGFKETSRYKPQYHFTAGIYGIGITVTF